MGRMGAGAPLCGFAELSSQAATESITFYVMRKTMENGVFGAYDPKAGACGSLYNLGCDPRLNHEFATTGGVLADECGGILTEFFASRR